MHTCYTMCTTVMLYVATSNCMLCKYTVSVGKCCIARLCCIRLHFDVLSTCQWWLSSLCVSTRAVLASGTASPFTHAISPLILCMLAQTEPVKLQVTCKVTAILVGRHLTQRLPKHTRLAPHISSEYLMNDELITDSTNNHRCNHDDRRGQREQQLHAEQACARSDWP